MPDFPETRPSLLARIRDPADHAAWAEFLALYRPVVYRLARRRGLQAADAEDLAQQVSLAVAGAIGRWDPDPRRGRFRAWLTRVARNAILNALTRGRPDAAAGGTSMLVRLHELPGHDPGLARELDEQYRRQLFRRAAARVRGEVHPETWAAFWMTAVEGVGVEEAAGRLGKAPGAIYAARSRVMRRLRDEVRELEGDGEGEGED